MTPSSFAGVVTAFATVFTLITAIVTAVTALMPILRISRDTHKIVNQQRTDMQRYQAALVLALKQAGIDVPVDQSLPVSDDQV